MKKTILGLLTISMGIFTSGSPALATKPGDTTNPNGFPPGFHYTLNIHAKNTSHVCDYKYVMECDASEPPVCVETDERATGGVVNVPDYQGGAEIRMLSGKGKKAAEFTELAVIDPCAGFPNNKNLTDNPYALLQLPKNEFGYDVYARPLGKVTKGLDTRNITLVPDLSKVLMEETDADGNLIYDQDGNLVTTDLLYLGLVTDQGFQTTTTTKTRGKGKSTASSITGLFLWTGEVCYFDSTNYCDNDCTSKDICCESEIILGEDGLPVLVDGLPIYKYVECEDAILSDPSDPNSALTCNEVGAGETPLSLVSVDCKAYEDKWVFNIADLVEYMWTVQSTVKQFNVRFYPRSE